MPVTERALPMHAGHNPRAAIFYGRINQGHPTSQVVLRCYKVITIVLMPGKFFQAVRLFIYRLIPIEPTVRAEQVKA